MKPAYFAENRYSYLVDMRSVLRGSDYEIQTAETEFERSVQQQMADANAHLQNEEYRLALDAYTNLRGLILSIADPKLPPSNTANVGSLTLNANLLVEPLFETFAHVLQETPVSAHTIPAWLLGDRSRLPDEVLKRVAPYEAAGLQDEVTVQGAGFLSQAADAIRAGRFEEGRDFYDKALSLVPPENDQLQAHVMHDLAILQERAGDRERAIFTMEQSIKILDGTQTFDVAYDALITLAGMQKRGGDLDSATATLQRAERLKAEHNLFPIVIDSTLELARFPTPPIANDLGIRPRIRESLPGPILPAGRIPGAAAEDLDVADRPVRLTALSFLLENNRTKSLSLIGEKGALKEIVLDGNAQSNLKKFYEDRVLTDDIELLDPLVKSYPVFVAFLPHLYFFVLPMAIGDCYAGMGDFEQAETYYLSVLAYPYVNEQMELFKVWTRLADLYLEWGDRLYRQAKNDSAAFAAARQLYERVVRTDGSIDPTSPLYKDSKFDGIEGRVVAILAAADIVAVDENAALLMRIARARTMLEQIAGGLNFFGFAPDYLPPFSFEHLQNVARYFAQHAAQVEHQYIQFKSQAENEQLRREQLEQQAEIASASVELERRGLAETEAGVNVAQATVNYAEVQRQNAQQSQNDFNSVRWELAELAELEAWSQAASMPAGDEQRQTINNFTYFNATNQRRSIVIQLLARQRTRITHNLEANRLQRELNSAGAYKAVAQAQLDQARARRAIAEHRVAIAQLQQRFAEENRDFLELKEFSDRLWYDLAAESRRLARRYLDMAIETAFLAERAYFAETGRDLRTIKFIYGERRLRGLLAADTLLADIDSFSLDHIRTRSKRAQIKQIFSVADEFPMAFSQLKRTGLAMFETTLDHFDRQYPGYYLPKIQNVELVLVGPSSLTGVRGTLRNVGVSNFRHEDGTVDTLAYPSDVMPLSQYDVRQDTLVFRFDPKDLRLFENNAPATQWQIELPLDSNDFNFDHILDVHLVLYFDAFFSPQLETTIRAGLPDSGEASRAISLRLYAPDELFYLRNQGSSELVFDAGMFPRNQIDLERSRVVVQAAGDDATVDALSLHIESEDLGSSFDVTLSSVGLADSSDAGSPLAPLVGRPVFDRWTITIDPADNPGLVVDGQLDLSGLRDMSVFLEYDFDYRG